MEIKTMGVLGSINTPIETKKLSNFDNTKLIKNSQIQIGIEDNITACIYRSGKIQIFGIKKIDKIQYYWDKTLNYLSKFIDVSQADLSPELKFIVASEKLPFKVNLMEVMENIKNESIEYEPEQFPGIIWRFKTGTCLLFSTGSCIITGSNTIEKIQFIIEEVKNKLYTIYKQS